MSHHDKPLTLLGDLTPADFLANYWQQKPLLIRGAFETPKSCQLTLSLEWSPLSHGEHQLASLPDHAFRHSLRSPDDTFRQCFYLPPRVICWLPRQPHPIDSPPSPLPRQAAPALPRISLRFVPSRTCMHASPSPTVMKPPRLLSQRHHHYSVEPEQ